ncbi:MAG TPA: PepSY domain-containing protein [Cellvibrionaceae bacterium]
MASLNKPAASSNTGKILYRTLWRWHFYAGIFTIPFIIILSVTGALYLFKPQLDALHDAPFNNLVITAPVTSPQQQVNAVLSAMPDARLTAYQLPQAANDAVNILVNVAGEPFRVYVHPQTLSILNSESEHARFLHYVHDIHGELLIGKTGSIIVELAASWAIVLIFTGLYLWWPRNAKGLGGIIYPRLYLKGRLFWRDLHSVIGIWLSFCVLFLLISGLPWAFAWGSAFKEIRTLTGTAAPKQDWIIAGGTSAADNNSNIMADSGAHAEHQHDHSSVSPAAQNYALIDTIVANAQILHLAAPVLISAPSEKSPYWSAKSNSQNRPLRSDAYFDTRTGELTHEQTFAQRHIIDRVVGFGIAAHEGQLFGWLNQLVGLITALGLIIMSISGFIMWRKRAPTGALGAPPPLPDTALSTGFIAIILLAALLLPTLAVSLMLIITLEKTLLHRWPAAQKWLGV